MINENFEKLGVLTLEYIVRCSLAIGVLVGSVQSYGNDNLGEGWIPGNELPACHLAAGIAIDLTTTNTAKTEELNELRSRISVETIEDVRWWKEFVTEINDNYDHGLGAWLGIIPGVAYGFSKFYVFLKTIEVSANTSQPANAMANYLNSPQAKSLQKYTRRFGVFAAVNMGIWVMLPHLVDGLEHKIEKLKRANSVPLSDIESLESAIAQNKSLIIKLMEQCDAGPSMGGAQ